MPYGLMTIQKVEFIQTLGDDPVSQCLQQLCGRGVRMVPLEPSETGHVVHGGSPCCC